VRGEFALTPTLCSPRAFARGQSTYAREVLWVTAHGVDAGRIEIVSYGKERPIDPGHDETAWAKDRNDQFENLTTSVVLR
jgi:hypothetical protein